MASKLLLITLVVLPALFVLVPTAESTPGDAAAAAAAEYDPKLVTTEVHGEGGKVRGTYCCLKNGFGCVQDCEEGKSYECCLKNGFGCMQKCETGKSYECCLKNGFGCKWKCENGIEHYCCERNGFGCTKMCPKLSSNIALPSEKI